MRPLRRWLAFCVAFAALPAFAGSITETSAPEPTKATALSFEAGFEYGYFAGSDVERGRFPNRRQIRDFDETYAAGRFVYTPRIAIGILRVGAAYERFGFGFPSRVQLPDTLQSLSAVIGLDTQLAESILVRFEAQPGFYGTADDFYEGTFMVPFIFGGSYIYSSDLQFILGVGVNFDREYPVFPGVGVRWRFAPQWTLNAVVPKPRLEYAPNKSLTFYGGADLRGSAFRTRERFGTLEAGDSRLNHAVISYTEVRTGVGVEFNLSPEIQFVVEGGYVPYRNFDYHRADVRYRQEKGAPYGAVSLRANF
jgi:hypothetical protein